jgi:hypothetical protein
MAMKHTIRVALLAFLATTVLATASFAEWVYVTKNGEKYHHENSRFAKMEGAQRILKEEAEKQGFEPSTAYLRTVEKETEEKKQQ